MQLPGSLLRNGHVSKLYFLTKRQKASSSIFKIKNKKNLKKNLKKKSQFPLHSLILICSLYTWACLPFSKLSPISTLSFP